MDARFLVPAARCQGEQGLFGKMWNGRFSESGIQAAFVHC